MAKTLITVPVASVPGITIRKLTVAWEHDTGILPVGTEITPLHGGYDSTRRREYQTVSVRGTGEVCTGPA